MDMEDINQPITATTSVAPVVNAPIALTVVRGPYHKDNAHFFYLGSDAQRSLDVQTGEISDDSFSLYMPDDASNSKYHQAVAYLAEHGSISYKRLSK
tara:strand:+ start:2752 stop:3042 length:291 start_codon:yes stop_codon:yes gene_type:complete